MGIMDASGLWSFVNSIYFQIRKPQTNIFLVKKSTFAWVKISKKKDFFGQTNRKKLILQLEKYFKTLKDMIIGTAGT